MTLGQRTTRRDMWLEEEEEEREEGEKGVIALPRRVVSLSPLSV